MAVAKKKVAKKKAAKKKAAPKKKSTARKKTVTKLPKRKTPRKSVTPNNGASQLLQLHGIAPYKEKKGEAYMSKEQEDHFRMILNAWKSELLEEVDRTVHHMQDDAANFPDPNDRASQESEFALELRTRDRERKLIKKIEESLADLENKDYGYCETCGIEIGIRRLEARPTANLCIDCKTLDEIREKQAKG